jgi:hypothetical protein
MYPTAFLLVNQVHGISDHALKLISASKFPPSDSFPSLPCKEGIISTSVACLPKDKLHAEQEIPSLLQLS